MGHWLHARAGASGLPGLCVGNAVQHISRQSPLCTNAFLLVMVLWPVHVHAGCLRACYSVAAEQPTRDARHGDAHALTSCLPCSGMLAKDTICAEMAFMLMVSQSLTLQQLHWSSCGFLAGRLIDIRPSLAPWVQRHRSHAAAPGRHDITHAVAPPLFSEDSVELMMCAHACSLPWPCWNAAILPDTLACNIAAALHHTPQEHTSSSPLPPT